MLLYFLRGDGNMAGKFINTVQKDIITKLKNNNTEMLNNSYFTGVNNKRATLVDFFNVNTDATTLDEASKLSYNGTNEESPIRYDVIRDLFLYDVPAEDINLQNGDFGLEADSIEGEGLIPPNVFTPVPGSYLTFKNVKNPGLYKVTNVNIDTMENGANFYKINYVLDKHDHTLVEDQVINEFIFMVDKVGTQFKPIILKKDYNFAVDLQNVLTELSEYYKSLFFSEKVNTFVLYINDRPFYDSLLIEFISQNNLMSFLNNFLHIQHEVRLQSSFFVEYSKSIFRCVEKGLLDINRMPIIQAVGRFIEDPLSILSMRNEYYYMITYLNEFNSSSIRDYIVNTIDPEFINLISTNTLTQGSYTNIIIKYFNGSEITMDDIYTLDNINYKASIELFYNIPIIIYILKKTIEKLVQ